MFEDIDAETSLYRNLLHCRPTGLDQWVEELKLYHKIKNDQNASASTGPHGTEYDRVMNAVRQKYDSLYDRTVLREIERETWSGIEETDEPRKKRGKQRQSSEADHDQDAKLDLAVPWPIRKNGKAPWPHGQGVQDESYLYTDDLHKDVLIEAHELEWANLIEAKARDPSLKDEQFQEDSNVVARKPSQKRKAPIAAAPTSRPTKKSKKQQQQQPRRTRHDESSLTSAPSDNEDEQEHSDKDQTGQEDENGQEGQDEGEGEGHGDQQGEVQDEDERESQDEAQSVGTRSQSVSTAADDSGTPVRSRAKRTSRAPRLSTRASSTPKPKGGSSSQAKQAQQQEPSRKGSTGPQKRRSGRS